MNNKYLLNLINLQKVSRYFGSVIALQNVNFNLKEGEVHCLLGDNGAGKSTLIKILAGVYKPSEGQYIYNDQKIIFNSPREALAKGIATVYQDLALVPLMSVTRNFYMGRELTKRVGLVRVLDFKKMNEITEQKLLEMGISIRSPEQAVGTMSGGERQSLAIARAVHFGARVLILDEPTAALGVAQTSQVLKTINKARENNIGVIFITHNVHHALAVGDRFTVLNRGQTSGSCTKLDESANVVNLQKLMAGDKELADLSKDFGKEIKV